MEGLYRDTSEEIFLRSYIESSVPATVMDVLGFKSLSQNFRTDSEELFKSWLTNGESNCFNSPNLASRTRQAPRRTSSEITNSVCHVIVPQDTRSDGGDCFLQNDVAGPHSARNVVEKEFQASELYLAKAWFQSSQPMTRSRSSELRRRYAAMQSTQTPATMGFEGLQSIYSNGLNPIPLACESDKVSSVVSMLKGTLERKKLNAWLEKGTLVDESSDGVLLAEQVTIDSSFDLCPVHAQHEQDGFACSLLNPVQLSRVSQEPSQSESSAEQSRNKSSENGSSAKDLRERIIGSFKEDRKRGNLQRHGSVTSVISGDKGDATKKRRVERSRKMAEAKERNSTPTIPSDMQAVLKRCETLEKEVRSLKLNLSFMNRKDSEQTKQIEELQRQNEELIDEKECLVEEINKIATETGKI